MHWRRKWQPTPVFLPGESQGRGSLVGCRLWGRTESARLKRLSSSSSRDDTGFPGGSDGKESTCNTGDLSSILGLGRSSGGGHGNPLQYSCLENPHKQRSLAGYSPWGHKELDTTKQLSTREEIVLYFIAHKHFTLIFKRQIGKGNSVS